MENTENETKLTKEEIKNLNLYQRLSEVRKIISFLKTEKQTYEAKYPTTKSSQVLYPLHKPINDFGLLLIPEILSEDPAIEIPTSGGGKRYLVKLNMEMTWINIDKPDERHTVKWMAKGINTDPDKAVGAALTYGERYFLLKFFNISTDKDDPDMRVDEPDNNKKSGSSGTGKNAEIKTENDKQAYADLEECETDKDIETVFNNWKTKVSNGTDFLRAKKNKIALINS